MGGVIEMVLGSPRYRMRTGLDQSSFGLSSRSMSRPFFMRSEMSSTPRLELLDSGWVIEDEEAERALRSCFLRSSIVLCTGGETADTVVEGVCRALVCLRALPPRALLFVLTQSFYKRYPTSLQARYDITSMSTNDA
jgi:hypothetical protein